MDLPEVTDLQSEHPPDSKKYLGAGFSQREFCLANGNFGEDLVVFWRYWTPKQEDENVYIYLV